MPPMLEYFLPGRQEGKRFIDLSDGRILYVPRGRGPVYIVPDQETRKRFERRFNVVDRVTNFALGAGLFLAVMFRLWTVVPPLIVLGVLLPRWVDRVVVESLPEARDPDALRAAERHRPSPASLGQRLGGLAGGAGLLGFGLYRWTNHGGLSDFTAIGALAVGIVVLVTSLSGWGDEHSDEYLTAVHAPPDNVPNEPKYF
jgi:hypothetical protein